MTAGRVQVLSRRCATCIFRSGDPMSLGAERTREVIQANLAAGALLVCHTTLPYGEHPEAGEAMCRGYWDAYRDRTNVVRVMDRLSAALGTGEPWWAEVDPPGQEAPPGGPVTV